MTDHGKNIDPFSEIEHEIGELYEQISGVTKIESEEQHNDVTSLHDALHDAGKRAEELRKDLVKPFDEAKAKVQDQFHPLIGDTKKGKGKVVRGKEVLQEILGPWRKRVADEKAALALKAAKEAEAERLAAVEAMQASSGDLDAREAAEQLVSSAEQAERIAKQAGKAATTGLGLRTVWIAEIIDTRAAVISAMKRDPDAFLALAQTVGDQAARSGVRELNGFNIYSDKVAK